jgi:hypothetical protein
MVRALSNDLRERVVSAVQSGDGLCFRAYVEGQLLPKAMTRSISPTAISGVVRAICRSFGTWAAPCVLDHSSSDVMLFKTIGHCSEVFDLLKEPLDQVAVAVKERTESGNVDPSWHRLDVGPGAAICQSRTRGVTVVGPGTELLPATMLPVDAT